MTRSPKQFTLKGLMIVVAAMAVAFALPAGFGLILIAFSIPLSAIFWAQWLVFRRKRRIAACAFWGTAIGTNVLTTFACIVPESYALVAIFIALSVIAIPTIVALGSAWARLLAQDQPISRQFRWVALMSTIVLTALPILTLWTLWPLHVAYGAARPALERLADRVAAGNMIGFPQDVGFFRIAAAAVDPVSRTVSLMIDPNPNCPSGFVRVGAGTGVKPNSSIWGSNLHVELGGGWTYREDD